MIKLLKASALAAATAMSLATILPTTASAYTFPPGVGQSHCCHDIRGGGHDRGGHGGHDGDFHHWGHEWGYRGFYGYGYGYPTGYSSGESCPVGYFLNYWGHCRPRPFPIRPF